MVPTLDDTCFHENSIPNSELSRFIFTIGFQPVTLQNHELVPLDQDYFMMKSLRSEMNFEKNADLQLTNIPLENTDEENIGLFQCALTECLGFFCRSKLVFGSFHNIILLFDPCPKSFGLFQKIFRWSKTFFDLSKIILDLQKDRQKIPNS